jgi:quercetin dioxygenase-like cupin family protein
MHTRAALAAAFFLGACAGAVVSNLPGSPAAAEAPSPVRVLPAAAQVTRVAPHGKARVIELARGEQAFLGILELDGGASVPEHQDETEEYLYVLAGSGRVAIDGTTTAVGAGDAVYMPAMATVSYVNGPEPLRVVQVFAGPGPAGKYDGWKPR